MTSQNSIPPPPNQLLPQINLPRPMLTPPLRRQHVAQPPTLLTTSLNNHAHSLGLSPIPHAAHNVHTPLSATSLSSPFAFYGAPSAYPASPAGGASSSPMAMRSATGFSSAPYNPQQWGRISHDSPSNAHASFSPIHGHQTAPSQRQVMYAPRIVGPDEPMGSPPPPYSADGTSPADNATPSTEYSHPTAPSSATAMSPATHAVASHSPNPYMQQSPIVGQVAFPPPPGQSNTNPRIRSSSRNHADRLLSAISLRGRGNNSASPPNAIDTLQHHTAQVLGQTELRYPVESPSPIAPSSRRAASTGAIGSSAYASRPYPQHNESPVQPELQFAVPPPPPGPPPSASRSQSVGVPTPSVSSVSSSGSSTAHLVPRQRLSARNAGLGTSLGPVPPTPANWQEGDPNQPNDQSWPRADTSRSYPAPLHVDTENLSRAPLTQSPDAEVSSGGASASPHVRRESSGLIRSPAVRNRSATGGLRERRSASKAGRDGTEELASPNDALTRPLQDLVLDGSQGTISNRRASARTTPRGANFRGLDEALRSADSTGPLSSGIQAALQTGSSMNTPNAEQSRRDRLPGQMSPTPPFSPGGLNQPSSASGTFPSRTLPTPPLQPVKDSHASLLASHGNVRPLSSLLHMPNDNVNVQVLPLSPESNNSLLDFDSPESPVAFANRANERHRIFAQKEAAATSDSERLQYFTEYINAESRIRRDKYAAVFQKEDINPRDLTDLMFQDTATPAVDERVEEFVKRSSMDGSRPSSGTSFTGDTSRRPSSSSSSIHPILPPLDTSVNDIRGKNYVPCLSPIASMSAVTGREDENSRGRAPSRWWESASNSSNKGDGFKVLERSKRETKYMSAVIESEQPTSASFEASSSSHRPGYGPGSSLAYSYGLDEYPPEKVDLDQQHRQSLPPPPPHPPTSASAPFTPDPRKLDISRLITMPPPYPRHHPAVNNNHPDLDDIRGVVRSLNDLEDVETARASFDNRVVEKRQRADSWCKHQKSLHNQDVQYRIEHGEISQQEFDEAEVTLEGKMNQSAKDIAQGTFDLFQTLMVTPLHALYTERISQATSSFNGVTTRLDSDSQTHSPNLPQEAGDEQPELLERLTTLKWLFEAREMLHRELYNLLSERNEKYKAIVLLPYRQSRNQDKIAETEAFFEKDNQSRRAVADKSALARFQEFRKIIESHVTRGVEVQLSAFWDIAPPLQALLQQVPDGQRLFGFEILIPKEEVDENPAYWTYPLRYLYSVLQHAEASSRQFVDSQVSLWCLLQEVREGLVTARWRAKESRAREDEAEWGWREERAKEDEVRAGMDDLKERVGAVEGQWVEGLGGEIGRVKTGVRSWLEDTGGWDEELEAGE